MISPSRIRPIHVLDPATQALPEGRRALLALVVDLGLVGGRGGDVASCRLPVVS